MVSTRTVHVRTCSRVSMPKKYVPYCTGSVKAQKFAVAHSGRFIQRIEESRPHTIPTILWY